MFTLVMAFVVFGIGVFAFTAPVAASKQFGIQSNDPFVRATGARDIYIGAVLTIAWWYGQLVGPLCLAVSIVSICDAYLTWRAGAYRYALVHTAGTVAVVGYGLWMLGR